MLACVVLTGTIASGQQLRQEQQAAQLDTVRKILTQAAEKATAIVDEHQRETILGLVAIDLADAGYLEAALATTELIERPEGRHAVWVPITRQLARRGEVEKAFYVLERIEDPTSRALALAQLATSRAWEGDISMALQIAHGIPPTEATAKVGALGEIGFVQARASDLVGAAMTFDQAEQAAAEEQDAGRRVELLSHLVAYRSSARDRPGAVTTARRVESEADKLPAGKAEEKARGEVAGAKARAGEGAEAQVIASEIEDRSVRATALARVAAAQALEGRVADALETAESIENKEERAWALHDIAAAQARTKKGLEGALRTAARIESPAIQAETLRSIAIRQARIGDARGAASTIEQALAAARSLPPEDPDRDKLLAEVVSLMAETEDIDGAAGLAKSVTQPEYQTNAYEDIARAEAYFRRTTDVPAWVNELDSPANQAHALRGFASGLLLRMRTDAREAQRQRER